MSKKNGPLEFLYEGNKFPAMIVPAALCNSRHYTISMGRLEISTESTGFWTSAGMQDDFKIKVYVKNFIGNKEKTI